MARLALLWMLAGFIVGGAMLLDRDLPGNWRLWAQPTHGHMLFVGWFLQFALGIAYWLLPRKRSPERPAGYNLRVAQVAVAALNIGLLCRVIAEPLERSGHAGNGTLAILALSAALQIGAAVVFVVQIWPRVAVRPARSQVS